MGNATGSQSHHTKTCFSDSLVALSSLSILLALTFTLPSPDTHCSRSLCPPPLLTLTLPPNTYTIRTMHMYINLRDFGHRTEMRKTTSSAILSYLQRIKKTAQCLYLIRKSLENKSKKIKLKGFLWIVQFFWMDHLFFHQPLSRLAGWILRDCFISWYGGQMFGKHDLGSG